MRLRLFGAAVVLMLLAPLAQAADTPSQTLDNFHKALKGNDTDAVLAILAKDAVIYEQGFSETSRGEWARKQLGTAISFARDTERRVMRRQAGQSGDTAWVISTTQTTVDVAQRKLVLEGAETAILRREGSTWQIVHLHWSAHEAEAPAAAATKP